MSLADDAATSFGPATFVPALLLLPAAFYLRAYLQVRRRRVGWPHARVVSFFGGLAAAALAMLPPVSSHDEQFPVHITQHLLLGMAAPLLLALSAPLTLALRTLAPRPRRRLARIVHARPLRLVINPVPAALLDFGPLALLYLTPIYGYTLTHPAAHELLHAHFLLAGCLFAWATVAADALPGRASLRLRGAAIVVGFAAHGIIAKMAYAAGPGSAGAHEVTLRQWQFGTKLMWYGGDVIELLLVLAYALQWYRFEGRRLARAARREVAPATGCS